MLLGLAVLSYRVSIWASLICVLATCGGGLFASGFRVTVTPQHVVVRLGTVGLALLRVALSDLANIEVHAFSPLRHFGGYGIRMNREVHRAIYYRGTVGVLLTTRTGVKYLIGSGHPERLAAVLRAAEAATGVALA